MTEFLSYFDMEQKKEPIVSNNTTSSGLTISFAEGYGEVIINTSIDDSFLRRLMIIKNPEICQGQPTIKGTRISVSNIVEIGRVLSLDMEKDIERINSEYSFLNTQQIMAALEYYYENKNEIDNFIRQEKEIDGS